jgi:hypothetical protein
MNYKYTRKERINIRYLLQQRAPQWEWALDMAEYHIELPQDIKDIIEKTRGRVRILIRTQAHAHTVEESSLVGILININDLIERIRYKGWESYYFHSIQEDIKSILS